MATKCADHRELYKARSARWKETYRTKCLQRLRDKRERLVAQQREIRIDEVRRVMDEEMETMAREGAGIEANDLVEFMVAVEEELRREVRTCYDGHHDQDVQFTEALLAAHVTNRSSSAIACPLCKSFLKQCHGLIHCDCGLRINTDQDCISLDYVRIQLEESTTRHGLQCTGQPAFAIWEVPEVSISNLTMTCDSCDCLEIIV
ncbi:RPA-interacting protein A-like isoform X2 [Corticium candelabrum]|uniref:RPA-interacting protein A-like isoform X2 n=1 Tax=Corticium candelabrum TaxID=121492 RepID=UPI002E270456|nr:RPA-interacting protein A-like isoform X2 [Corticium candelabrum]